MALFFLIFFSGLLISRIMIIYIMKNEIIFFRMVMAGFGADLAVVALICLIFISFSFVFGRKKLIQYLAYLVLLLLLLFAYINHRYVLTNHQVIPFKNIYIYSEIMLEDEILRRGVMSEFLNIDFGIIFILPLIIFYIFRKNLFGWLFMGLKQKLLLMSGILIIGIFGNGMKWTFDVIRNISSPIVSNYVYYWIQKPFDNTVLNYVFPNNFDHVASMFEHPYENSSKIKPKKKYNILIIIAESFRSAENSAYGAEPGVTPYFENLTKKGILFTNIYHNGCCSPEGTLAILCAQQPQISYITVNQTYAHFTCLPDYLKQIGYRTSWVYAMGSGADRFGAFHRFHQTDHIVDGFNFPKNSKSAGWTYADEETFKMARKYWDQIDEPTYMVVQTSTSHSPFFVPEDFKKRFHSRGEYFSYLNSLAYVDEQIGLFLKDLLNSRKGKNSIIILTADHSTQLPARRIDSNKNQYLTKAQVPLLMILPEDLNQYPKTVDTLGSLIDIVPTLLDILGENNFDTTYGYSLLKNKKTPRFVYVTEFGTEALITEEFLIKLLPEKKVTKWTGENLTLKDNEFEAWNHRIAILKNYNLWRISIRDKKVKDTQLAKFFEEQSEQ